MISPTTAAPLSRRYAKIGLFGLVGLVAHGLLVGAPDVKAIWKRSTALSHAFRTRFMENFYIS
jgi:hypothetical protein